MKSRACVARCAASVVKFSLSAGRLSTRSAEDLLERMLIRIDLLSAERDRLVGEWRIRTGASSAARQ
jgi:hypothetical protein